MISRRTTALLVLIWAVFLIRGVFYSTYLPLWEGWDEYGHFAFVQSLSQGNSLPTTETRVSVEVLRSLELTPLPWGLVERPGPGATHETFWALPASERAARLIALQSIPREDQTTPGPEVMYEGKQAPLYYWLTALVVRPFSGTSLVTREFVARLFGVLLASSVVFLGFACALRLFRDELTALQIVAVVTAMPQLFMSMARVSNEPLSIAVFSLLTYLLLVAAGGKVQALFLAEIALGVGFLTKAYFVAAVPAVLAVSLLVLWREPRAKRLRMLLKIAAAGAIGLSVCAWWYIRSLSVTSGSPVWDDAAPAALRTLPDIFKALWHMHWFVAWDFTLNSHIWLSAWSVLGLRSWMYHAFRYGFILGYLGILIFFLRSLRTRQPRATEGAVIALLYGGFWASLLYHAFVSFSRGHPPASGGWYLLAAVVPEALVLVWGYWQFIPKGWRANVLTAAAGAFVVLEMYAMHFISFPYYAGITSHTFDGSLRAFHLSQAADLGWREILQRLTFNKPAAIGPVVFVLLWVVFIAVSMVLPFLPRLHQRYDKRT